MEVLTPSSLLALLPIAADCCRLLRVLPLPIPHNLLIKRALRMPYNRRSSSPACSNPSAIWRAWLLIGVCRIIRQMESALRCLVSRRIADYGQVIAAWRWRAFVALLCLLVLILAFLLLPIIPLPVKIFIIIAFILLSDFGSFGASCYW